MEAYKSWVTLPCYTGMLNGLLGICAIRAAFHARAGGHTPTGPVRGAAEVKWAVLQTLALYSGGFALRISAFLLLIDC